MDTNKKLIIGGVLALVVVALVAVILNYQNKKRELEQQQNDPEGYYNEQTKPFTYQELILGVGQLGLQLINRKKKKTVVPAPGYNGYFDTVEPNGTTAGEPGNYGNEIVVDYGALENGRTAYA